MEKRSLKVAKHWMVKGTITAREEHLFYRAVRTKVGAKYTPIASSSKINSEDSVTFFVVATCEYITEPTVTQYVTVQYDVVKGLLQEAKITVVGPEAVEFELSF